MTPVGPNPVFRLERVTATLGSNSVLRDIALEIGPGTMTAVVGANGSGKSSLLRVLAGLLAPSSGTVLFKQRPITAWHTRDRARDIALVPQDTAIPFEFTIREIVAMGRSPFLGRWGIESAADRAAVGDALELMELEGLADRSVLEVSGGERQRAVIARALAQQPSVMLLDEPGASLDLRYQIALFGLLRRLNRETGLTTVTVSHDLNAVAGSDQVIALTSGRLYAAGPPESVLTEPGIDAIFGCRALVDSHPVTARPRVTVVWTAP